MIFELGNKRLKGDGKYWVSPTANVIGDVTLKNNTSVWFNAVLRGDIENITVGEGSNIQDNCVLHTDKGFPLKIGEMVTVGHLVMLHGCIIMDNSLIGIGSTILNNSVIGNNCIIGANSLITERKIIPDNSLVMGSPGKVIRQVTEEEKKAITENAMRYMNNWKRYVKDLNKI
jgi:carbonic anhydrase/acetyltransferase-like protein (isoleucine patch superfamily)